jgi:hypothetical protein
MFKQGIEENVELCTTLGRESGENHGRSMVYAKPPTPCCPWSRGEPRSMLSFAPGWAGRPRRIMGCNYTSPFLFHFSIAAKTFLWTLSLSI